MTDVLWVIVGIIIGSIGGVLGISLVSAGRFEDKDKEIQKKKFGVRDGFRYQTINTVIAIGKKKAMGTLI